MNYNRKKNFEISIGVNVKDYNIIYDNELNNLQKSELIHLKSDKSIDQTFSVNYTWIESLTSNWAMGVELSSFLIFDRT